MSPSPHGFKVNTTTSTNPGTKYQDSGALTTLELFKAVNAQFPMTIKPETSAKMSPFGFKVSPTTSTTPESEYQDSGALTTLELFNAVNAQCQMTSKPETSAKMSPFGFKVNTTTSTTPRSEYQDSGALTTLELFNAVNAQCQMLNNSETSREIAPNPHGFKVTTSSTTPRTGYQDSGALSTLQLFNAVNAQCQIASNASRKRLRRAEKNKKLTVQAPTRFSDGSEIFFFMELFHLIRQGFERSDPNP
ncbi:hypothetical protein GCK72_025894 [Caenorhabditis remanei]|uniref:Uncharacterized protein n=1 Tax=Caenorhabditis remanei TaxID=31234 RepID=A0A6A5G3F2_CAERE|nr:hypothetical protein GCK72_025894 [Caenorhabditis remanei]KAF1749426.1 hypothetical protein GCK72_025894 [Caenorhabditis remanei]